LNSSLGLSSLGLSSLGLSSLGLSSLGLIVNQAGVLDAVTTPFPQLG
jgi:hypothetical protein